jgi:hypothetical protein
MPKAEDSSEAVTFYGSDANLLKALSRVMEMTSSIDVESLPLSDLQFRMLAAKERSKLKGIEEAYKVEIHLHSSSLDIVSTKESIDNMPFIKKLIEDLLSELVKID